MAVRGPFDHVICLSRYRLVHGNPTSPVLGFEDDFTKIKLQEILCTDKLVTKNRFEDSND